MPHPLFLQSSTQSLLVSQRTPKQAGVRYSSSSAVQPLRYGLEPSGAETPLFRGGLVTLSLQDARLARPERAWSVCDTPVDDSAFELLVVADED